MDIVEAIQKIKLGRAICFLGSGFSRGATDAQDRPIFGDKELRKELFSIAGLSFDPTYQLTDIANYCQKKDADTSSKLNNTILERFTLTKPTPDQNEILSNPWRSAFTTNYDDIPEQIWSGEHIQVFSPTEPNKILLSGRRLFYLHGRGRDIRSTGVDPLLILSSSEYAKSTKSHQKLRDYFSNELATSEAIIFIGYSARDLDFTRQLAALGGQIRERTLFIEAPNIGVIDQARLEEYGSIEAIGTEGLAKALRETQVSEILLKRPRLIREITVSDQDRMVPVSATDNDIHRQLLTGEFNESGYAAQQQEAENNANTSPSIIERKEKLDRVFQLLGAGNHRIVVTADVGNGKSFFLRQIEQRGLDKGYRVFRIDGSGAEYSSELVSLFDTPGKKLFVADDAIRYRHQLELVGNRLTNECGLIISNFNSFENIGIHDLHQVLGGQAFEVSIDKFTTQEVRDWVSYLNRWGLWGDIHGSYSDQEKFDYIIKQCGAEMRSTVISLYRNSKLASRIASIVDYFLSNSRTPNNLDAFIGAVITSLVDKHVVWKNVVDWLAIDETKFLSEVRDSKVASILTHKNGDFGLPSKQLARFFLESNVLDVVSLNDIANIYVVIVLGTARQMTDPRQEGSARENLKELMRFRILSLLFGSSNEALRVISSIYNKLSSNHHIQKRDQFWLQFAMARMADNDLDLAESYLKNAIGIAKGHGQDWDTKQIDDQFTRLWLKKAIDSAHLNKQELKNVIINLTKSLGDKNGDVIYPLRSAKFINPLLEKHIDEIDPDTVNDLKEVLDEMRKAIGKMGKLHGAEKGETEVLRDHIRRAQLIIQNA